MDLLLIDGFQERLTLSQALDTLPEATELQRLKKRHDGVTASIRVMVYQMT